MNFKKIGMIEKKFGLVFSYITVLQLPDIESSFQIKLIHAPKKIHSSEENIRPIFISETGLSSFCPMNSKLHQLITLQK